MSKSNTLNCVHGISILFKHLIFVLVNSIFCSKINIPHPDFWVNYSRWYIKQGFSLFCSDYQRACIVYQMGWNHCSSICAIFRQKSASVLLYIGKTHPLHWNSWIWLTEKRAKYHKTCFHKYYTKNKHSDETGSQKLEHSRTTGESSTETVALIECVFCGERERDLPKMSRKQKQSLTLHTAGEYHSPNVQHVEPLTEQWREIASL